MSGGLLSNRNLLRVLVALLIATVLFAFFFLLPAFSEVQNMEVYAHQPSESPGGSSKESTDNNGLTPVKLSEFVGGNIVIKGAGNQCLSWTYKSDDVACGKVKLRECSTQGPIDAQIRWNYEEASLTLSSEGNCLQAEPENEGGGKIRFCTCSGEDNQKWELPSGNYQEILSQVTAECISVNPETSELELRICSPGQSDQIWKLFSLETPSQSDDNDDDGEDDENEKNQNDDDDVDDEDRDSRPPTKPRIGDSSAGSIDHDTRNKVKSFMKLAWDNYVQYAWGADELQPISKSPRNWLGGGLAATIVDAIDTLYIMGMTAEYEKAREYILNELDFSRARSVSFFETTIRDLGGLLAIHGLTKDPAYIDKAKDLGNRLLPAFNSPSGLPFSVVDLTSGQAHNHNWNPGNHILAEIGTIQLEFKYLSEVTGNPVYAEKANRVFEILRRQDTADPGLFPVFYPESSGDASGVRDYALGGLGDSFYEYLLKQWLQTSRTETRFKAKYDESSQQIKSKMYGEAHGHRFVGKFKNGFLEPEMEHLACFTGGMFALGAFTETTSTVAADLEVGAELTKTCRASYAEQATGLGPEKFSFRERITADGRSDFYWLRPEYVESLFYMWRITKDPIYREWGKDMIAALEKHCMRSTGFVGITGVNNPNPGTNDVQESFFLAETLKYLYLLFSEDSLVSLDEYVFNTEAHPLPVFIPTTFDFSSMDA